MYQIYIIQKIMNQLYMIKKITYNLHMTPNQQIMCKLQIIIFEKLCIN